MAIEITSDPVSVETVNKKLESFVEVVLEKITELKLENKQLKARVKKLEKANG